MYPIDKNQLYRLTGNPHPAKNGLNRHPFWHLQFNGIPLGVRREMFPKTRKEFECDFHPGQIAISMIYGDDRVG